jgi:tetratricopeptide (TPR) repeat protein
LLLGISALETHRIQEAIVELEAAQELDPRSADVHYALALAFWWAERSIESTKKHIDLALAGHLSPPRRGFLSALYHLVEHRYAEAEAELRELEKQFPDFRDILYGRFEALYHGGHPKEAIELYRKLTALHPGFRLGVIHAYLYYLAHGDEEGMQWMEQQIGPAEESSLAAWRVRILFARRDYAGALALAGRVNELSENRSAGRATLSHAIVEMNAMRGQIDLAMADLSTTSTEHVLSLGPRLGLLILRGETAREQSFRAELAKALAEMQPGWPRLDVWITTAQIELLRSSELVELERTIEHEARLACSPASAARRPRLRARSPKSARSRRRFSRSNAESSTLQSMLGAERSPLLPTGDS